MQRRFVFTIQACLQMASDHFLWRITFARQRHEENPQSFGYRQLVSADVGNRSRFIGAVFIRTCFASRRNFPKLQNDSRQY